MTTGLNITAIVQVRMASTRLPGKSLLDVCGRPLLQRVLERVRRSRLVSRIVIATTTELEDGAIADFARQAGIPCYRGSTSDVLDRFHRAAQVVPTDIVVRITADDPLKDAEVIDLVVQTILDDRTVDYASNTVMPTFPEGLDVEAFTVAALARAWAEATLPSEREHVTPFIWKNLQRFHVKNVANAEDHSGLRWTVDYAEDLEFVRQVYRRLSTDGSFGWRDVISLLKSEPALRTINAGIARNAGYVASLANDSPACR